jgi:hypothetical protein
VDWIGSEETGTGGKWWVCKAGRLFHGLFGSSPFEVGLSYRERPRSAFFSSSVLCWLPKMRMDKSVCPSLCRAVPVQPTPVVDRLAVAVVKDGGDDIKLEVGVVDNHREIEGGRRGEIDRWCDKVVGTSPQSNAVCGWPTLEEDKEVMDDSDTNLNWSQRL